ncbi:MAG TPA: PIN domain-containing protein [Candidatus Nanoarchaeia archaeon]|nr:PIN domain-containing protein [Candidatus Nanoarchaeia archaeon]
MILDTSFVIDFFKNKKEAIEKAKELYKREEPLFFTAVTVFELWQNFDLGNKKKVEVLSEFVRSFGLFPLDVESAEIGGKIHAELADKGIVIEAEDCMIAGIALHNNQAVVTRDEHFSRIEGLKIVRY